MPQTSFTVHTDGAGLYEITGEVAQWAAAVGAQEGLCTLFLRHTSASLLIQENADPDVRRDLDAYFARLVPRADTPEMEYLTHRCEGPDDMPSHIKAALTATTLSVPIERGELALGTWQGIYLWEHRWRGSVRRCVVHIGA